MKIMMICTYEFICDLYFTVTLIVVYSDGPLFAPDQELALKVAGKNTGRRRKGRPRRTQKDQNISTELPDQKS